MTWVDVSLVWVIVLFIILLVWSRVQHQSMGDTLREVRDFIKETFGND